MHLSGRNFHMMGTVKGLRTGLRLSLCHRRRCQGLSSFPVLVLTDTHVTVSPVSGDKGTPSVHCSLMKILQGYPLGSLLSDENAT